MKNNTAEKKLRIAVDAMGGVNAPLSVISAVKQVSNKNPNVHFLLHGDSEIIIELLNELSVNESCYTIIDCKSIILDTDSPTEGLKGKKDSSMRCMIDSILAKEADACVSSGNTGALMLTARMILGSIPGVKRPAIAGVFPTVDRSQAILLDMGANISCDEIALSQFAIMGMCFAKAILGKENPSVGILNVGAEKTKGRDLEQKTHLILSSSIENFVGYVEGNEVIHGKADIVVTDGFSGNIFLKASEGAGKVCLDSIKRAFSENFITKFCGLLLKPYLKKNLEFFEPRKNNGAMLVGIKGIVVKSHGSSDDTAFVSAIEVAINLAGDGVNNKIESEMSKLTGLIEGDHSSDILEKIKHASAKIFGIGKK